MDTEATLSYRNQLFLAVYSSINLSSNLENTFGHLAFSFSSLRWYFLRGSSPLGEPHWAPFRFEVRYLISLLLDTFGKSDVDGISIAVIMVRRFCQGTYFFISLLMSHLCLPIQNNYGLAEFPNTQMTLEALFYCALSIQFFTAAAMSLFIDGTAKAHIQSNGTLQSHPWFAKTSSY